ncbi:LPXTG-site transpeptidase (sortase) family protein [Streptomyces sp. cf386]|uniref:class F sortase n=1 Tax=Streptomyces sp. cf386 TaxID=1761904 RepID=UPI000880E4E8|nr:class F sortase [Streptomyces sp. cf386]SDO06462.1 LPXTG-site transpeptidase (sortase) family protein [Streptomyces sp. cf386]
MTPLSGPASPTPLSRRAFGAAATAAMASLLVGCGGQGQEAEAASGQSRRTRGRKEAGGESDGSSSSSSSSSSPSANSARALGRSSPVRLQIPAIDVDTPVIRLGLASDGTVQVPPITADDRAGWYRHSPTPGQVGPSVLLGHVTVGAHGDGVFRHLARLRRGDRIVARREDGSSAEFTVSAVRTVAKADFPTDDVYGNVDRPELRLITCGGPRDGEEYRDNVIVFARLTSTTP